MDVAGGQGQVEFKESIGLQLIVKFDEWLKGLEKSEQAMNAFGAEATKVAAGLTTTFVVAQKKLEKTASGITGVFKTIRNDLAKTAALWGTASLAMAQHATTMQRSMFALEKAAISTGRSFSVQMKIIEDSIGGVASRAELLSSSVSLMSTSLDPTQMKQFVEVVKDTSAALGTDFSANVEHAVASLKNMDARLLANMGIMVSMEELTKKMTLKFPGADPETLSMQQKQAALLDIIIDKTKIFAGANKEMSEKGLFAWAEFKENLKDISIAIGKMFIPAWNEVAKVLAYVTKGIKNFFENESMQKFGKVIAAVVVPAMVLLLAVFTAAVPIVALLMKVMTVAPMIALTIAVGQFAKVLIGTGSATQAVAAFSNTIKNMGDPISAASKSFSALSTMYKMVRTEMGAMRGTAVDTGKTFTNLSMVIKKLKPELMATWKGSGAPQELFKLTQIPLVKEGYDKVAASATAAMGPVKGLQQNLISFRSALKSVFASLQAGIVGGIGNIQKLGSSLYALFGKAMIGAMGGFKVAFTVLIATIRIGVVGIAALLSAFLEIALPIVLLGYGIQKLIELFGYLNDKYTEHTDGSKELKEEVEALKKEYEGLAVAMDKVNPKIVKTQGYKDIVDYTERNNKKGADLSDEFLKDTGIKEAQSAGGRENIRKIVDQKIALKELRDGVSSVSIEFKNFSANVTELSSKAKDAYTQVKLYAVGLRTEEQAYEGMLAKASALNMADMEKYIKTTVEPQRKRAVDEALNKARKDFALAPELKVIEENTNKMFDTYIKLLKDPRKTQALLAVNRNNQLELRKSMRTDAFDNQLIENLKLSRGRIVELTSKIEDKRNELIKTKLEEMKKIEEDSFKERYTFLIQKLNEEYEAYKNNRERLVAMFEADQLNKTFFKGADGAIFFRVQINKLGSTINVLDKDIDNLSKLSFAGISTEAAKTTAGIDKSSKAVNNLNKEFISWNKNVTNLKAIPRIVDDMAYSFGEAQVNMDGMDEGLKVIASLASVVAQSFANAQENMNSVNADTLAPLVGILDALAESTGKAFANVDDLDEGISNIKTDKISDLLGAVEDLYSAEYDLGKVATDTNIKLSESAIQAAAAAADGAVALKSISEILKDVSTIKVGDSLRGVGNSIEEIDAKLQKLSLNKLKFEFATLEIQTAIAAKSIEKLKETWKANPEDFKDQITTEIDKQKGLMDLWIAKYTSASNQLLDNQKNILNKQRENVQYATEFARKMEDVSRAIEVADKNIRALRHTIAQQTDPAVDAQKAVLEIQAQQAQAIGDVVGYTEKRIKLLEKEYDAQEKLAIAAKAESEDINSTMEKRIAAAQKEQEIRKNMAQVGFELERMDPRKNLKPQQQLNRVEDIGKVLKDYLEKKNMDDKTAAELAKKIEEIKKETIIQEGTLNKLKFDMDMIVLAEERATMKIQQAIAESNQKDLRKLLIGLAEMSKTEEGDRLAEDLQKQFDKEDQRVAEVTAAAEADKKKTLAELGITAKSSVEQAKLIADQTKEVQALVNLEREANGILAAIRDGILSGNEAKDKAAKLTIGSAHNVAQERIAAEKKLSGVLEGGPVAAKIEDGSWSKGPVVPLTIKEKAIDAAKKAGREAVIANEEKRDKEHQNALNYLELFDMRTSERKDAYRGRRQAEYDVEKPQRDTGRAKREEALAAQNDKWQKLAVDAWDNKIQKWEAQTIPNPNADLFKSPQITSMANVDLQNSINNGLLNMIAQNTAKTADSTAKTADKDVQVIVNVDGTKNSQTITDFPLNDKSTAKAETLQQYYGDTGLDINWGMGLD